MSKPAIDPEALAVLADSMQQLVELACGHKAHAEQLGFSPTAAEHMAVEFHAGLMRACFTGSPEGAK